jgi:ankyrin repeat protein
MIFTRRGFCHRRRFSSRAVASRARLAAGGRAGAPLDHVNNLGWTALIECIVLGDGGPRHIDTLRALVDAGADVNLPDRSGQTPPALARARAFEAMVQVLERAGAR